MDPFAWALCNMALSTSKAIMKSNGDNGSPCLTDLVSQNFLQRIPFKRIDDEALAKLALTKLVERPAKPMLSNAASKNPQSILLDAFVTSSFIKT